MTPPVLCYHRVGGPPELGVTRVSLETFRRQMCALAKAGWRTLTLEQFAAAAHAEHSALRPPQSAFLLSFDDGYSELAEHAYPALAEVGFRATTFLITDFIGKTNAWDIQYTRDPLRHLDWDAIERWKARGFDFASHSATHARLTWLDDSRVRDELGRSRETLTTRMGADAGEAVAYPFGAVDERVARLAKGAGYSLGFDGVAGVDGDSMRLSRVPVYMWDLGDVPFGLRDDELGIVGRLVAYGANRAAVGTTVMRRLLGRDTPS
ncbi:MAG TPA: polysaccharide deacetylase family protein [Gemmatimonadales bacterium]|nr:polysaccharide deacetylase family protein [Gemmatimonadales bacterium]